MLVSGLQGAIDRRALVSASPDQFRSLSDMSPLRTPKHRHTAAPASGRSAPSRGECPTLPRDGASYRVSAGSAAQGRFGVGAAERLLNSDLLPGFLKEHPHVRL